MTARFIRFFYLNLLSPNFHTPPISNWTSIVWSMGNEILHKLLLGSCPSPSLKTRSCLYSVSVTTITRTIRTPPKYIRKKCISDPKFCKTTLLTNIKIKLWWSWTLHPKVLITIGKVSDDSNRKISDPSIIVMWALKTASWSKQVLYLYNWVPIVKRWGGSG